MTEKQMYGMRLCVNGPGKRVPTAFSRMAWGKRVSASMIPAKMHNSMSIRRKAVRWRYWVWSKWSTLLCLTTPMVMLMSTSHTSHTEVRWSTKWPVNQRMPSGLVSEWVNDSGIAAVSSHETRITTTSAIPNNNAR